MFHLDFTSGVVKRMRNSEAEKTSIKIEFESDNGTVPPPYRRSTHISIDADGVGQVQRRLGYDLQDPAQGFEISFVVSPEDMRGFGRLVGSLKVFAQDWSRAEDAPTGGPLTYLTLQRGDDIARIPPYPRTRQREIAEQLRSAVRALLPTTAVSAYRAWEQAHGGEE